MSRARLIAVLAALLISIALIGRGEQSRVAHGSPIRQIYLASDPFASPDGTQFWIRVTEQPESGSPAFVAGAFYLYSSAPSQQGPWTSIMRVHLDDPEPIPTGNVVFVNDKLGVTEDAGYSWSIWEPVQANSEWRPKRAAIKEVLLSADGTGKLQLEVFPKEQVVMLRTRDFGKNWTPH